MITKKNIFHYLVYVIFALIFFSSIGLYAVKLQKLSGESEFLIPLIIKYAVVFTCTAVVIYGYRLLIKYLPEKYIPKKLPTVSSFIELIGIVFCVILAAFVRLIAVANVFGHEVESVYYDYACGKNVEIPSATISLLYANICKFIGGFAEGPYLIYAFNGVLQIGSIALLYYFIKSALRMRYAIAACLLLAFLPACFNSVIIISSDHLLCFFFVLFLFTLGKICDMNKKGKITENYQILFVVLCGIIAGALLFFDILGISSLIVGISCFLLIKSKDPWILVQKNWFQALIFALSSVATAALLIYCVPINSVKGVEAFIEYGMKFVPSGLSLDILVPLYTRPESIVIYILVQIAILSFIRNDEDNGLIFVIISDFVALFTFVSFRSGDYMDLNDLSFCVLGVIGLFSVPSFVLTKEEIESAREKKRNKEFEKEKKQFKKSNSKGTVSLSLEPSQETNDNEGSDIVFKNDIKKTNTVKEEPQVVSAPPQIPANLQNEKKTAVVEVVKKEAKPLIPKEEVLTEPEPSKNVIPSRREYRTAHVYKNEEEKAVHESKMKLPVVTSVQTDASLKEKSAIDVNKKNSVDEGINLIKNVLPTPKPHVTKELSFDIDPVGKDLDYDIIDLKGKDYYDI